jgi:tRNA pseudouridine38-40 synthase
METKTPAEVAMPPRWRAHCAYFGAAFSGWQSQPDGKAVQDVLERALARILERPVRVHGSSRTDAGVSARGQVFHFDAPWRHGSGKLLKALRGVLPRAVFVYHLSEAASGFHARYSACGKRYEYLLVRGAADPFEQNRVWEVRPRLDLVAMQLAAQQLTGRHDFRAFSAESEAGPEDTVKTLWRLDCSAYGRRVRIDVEGSGFLYKMVRSLAGFLVRVGEGKLPPDSATRILASKLRTAEVETAPADGLCLRRVYYGRLPSYLQRVVEASEHGSSLR